MSLPPSEIPQGAIRFNTDSQKLEFYAQGEWWVMSTDTPNLGRGADSTPGARGQDNFLEVVLPTQEDCGVVVWNQEVCL
jgi:hypothetical protein